MADTVQPTLYGLSFPRTIDLSSGAKTITFAASADDDLSGVSYAVITFDKGFGSAGSSFYLFGSNDSWADGSSAIQATIPVGARTAPTRSPPSTCATRPATSATTPPPT